MLGIQLKSIARHCVLNLFHNLIITPLKFTHVWLYALRHPRIYSFIMLRTDKNLDGAISPENYADMLADLGAEDSETVLKVHGVKNSRRAPALLYALRQLGIPLPLETDYVWTAPDGYPLGSDESCQFSIAHCIGYNSTTTSQSLFRRLAFEQVRCGDCLLKHLINRGGLETILPPTEPDFGPYGSASSTQENLIGIVPDWREASFKVDAQLVSKIGRRRMALQNLQRYNYVIGVCLNCYFFRAKLIAPDPLILPDQLSRSI